MFVSVLLVHLYLIHPTCLALCLIVQKDINITHISWNVLLSMEAVFHGNLTTSPIKAVSTCALWTILTILQTIAAHVLLHILSITLPPKIVLVCLVPQDLNGTSTSKIVHQYYLNVKFGRNLTLPFRHVKICVHLIIPITPTIIVVSASLVLLYLTLLTELVVFPTVLMAQDGILSSINVCQS